MSKDHVGAEVLWEPPRRKRRNWGGPERWGRTENSRLSCDSRLAARP